MAIEIIPEWLSNLDDEDINFIKKFLMASGSLKEIAKILKITEPAVKMRLVRAREMLKIEMED